MHKIITTIILLCTFASVYAQNDPTLAALVAVYTNQAEKELKNQETVMLLQTTGHVWLRDETEATTKLQREFNDYLDTFRSVIVYAAEVYGFYHETAGLIDNTSDLISLTEAHPSNSLAVALSARRNTLYRQIITGGLDIV
ncbi:MAG: hypothetical protein LUC22_05565, partial [Prevotella sp.]|nr:hypothetical protein [Prevotella sp.]